MRLRWSFVAAALACGPEGAPNDSAGSTSITLTGSTGSTGPSDPSTTGTTTGGAHDCDVWQQDCPEGQKCVPWPPEGDDAWSTARCVPLAAEPGDSGCLTQPFLAETDPDALDNCAEGTLCWPYAYGTVIPYVCISQCEGSPDDPECPEGRACNVRDGHLALCEVVACDPLEPLCLDGRVCGFDGLDQFTCLPANPSPSGLKGCEQHSDCSPGFLCAPGKLAAGFCEPGYPRCCLEACDLDLGLCAIAEFTCLPFFAPGEAPLEHADVGVCGAT